MTDQDSGPTAARTGAAGRRNDELFKDAVVRLRESECYWRQQPVITMAFLLGYEHSVNPYMPNG